MGNNQFKKLGIKPKGTISSKAATKLWKKYDKNNSGTMEMDDAKKFLKQFAKEVKVDYDDARAEELVRKVSGGSDILQRESFIALIALEANQTPNVNLTMSMHQMASSFDGIEDDFEADYEDDVVVVKPARGSIETYTESVFREKVRKALVTTAKVLDINRSPALASDVHHSYDDKYLLAEFVTKTALAAQFQILQSLGLRNDALKSVRQWARLKSVTLLLSGQETCEFVKKKAREIESPSYESHIGRASIKSKTITTVQDYYYKFTVEYSLTAFKGNNRSESVVLQKSKGSTTLIITDDDSPPYPKSRVIPDATVDITYLLSHLNDDYQPIFSINRKKKDCRTPRRNPNIETAEAALTSIYWFSKDVCHYFGSSLFPVEQNKSLNTNYTSDLFLPTNPLLENTEGEHFVTDDINLYLSEHHRSMNARLKTIASVTREEGIISTSTVSLAMLADHNQKMVEHYVHSLEFIEQMLRDQLVAALGKEVSPADFFEYMEFHNRKLYKRKYAPAPFSRAIRRAHDFDPEGVVSIERQASKQKDDGVSSLLDQPVMTTSRCIENQPMSFALDASSKVSFGGPRYVHSWVGHSFSGASESALYLKARARQFSSFIVLIGNIASSSLFMPKYAFIAQNKDEFSIPLDLEAIPTRKEFKAAIVSISEEQQRFAKAYRKMQLESTLFGVCILQIKPQIEAVLKVSSGCLTKEIMLNQYLMSIFLQYQIPSDLLSYDGDENASKEHKLGVVKGYVEKVREMIESMKEKVIEEEKMEESYGRVYEDDTCIKLNDWSDSCESECEEYDDDDGDCFDECKMREFCAPPPPVACAPVSSLPPPPKPPAPTRTPTAPKASTQPKAEQPKKVSTLDNDNNSASGADVVDFTKIPAKMDKLLDKIDGNNTLRPTILSVGDRPWNKKSQKSLLSVPESSLLEEEQQLAEKHKAFDLLDALTKSGGLAVDAAELHIVIASTQCFDKTLVNTLVQENINPIERVERSQLIVSSVVHAEEPENLMRASRVETVKQFSPCLFSMDENTVAAIKSSN